MKSINKKYVVGFLLIVLIGCGLIVGGFIHLKSNTDLIETEATVLGVQRRVTDDGIEYQPLLLRYYVDGKQYEVTNSVWFVRHLSTGDTITIWYKKDNPNYTVISNASKETISYALMGCGGVLIVAGILLTGKYLYDVKRHKKV